jgi:hypothetical protein
LERSAEALSYYQKALVIGSHLDNRLPATFLATMQ